MPLSHTCSPRYSPDSSTARQTVNDEEPRATLTSHERHRVREGSFFVEDGLQPPMEKDFCEIRRQSHTPAAALEHSWFVSRNSSTVEVRPHRNPSTLAFQH